MSTVNTKVQVRAVYYGEHTPVEVEFRWQDYGCLMRVKEDLTPVQLSCHLEDLARRIREDIKNGIAK